MTYSPNDYKPFARVWRKYENALSRIHVSTMHDAFQEEQWESWLEIGTNPSSPPIIRSEVVSPHNVKPWMRPNPYDEDGAIRINRNPELDALGEVDEAAQEWAEMLLPLEGVEAHSVPSSINGSSLREIRSAIYSLSINDDSQQIIELVWTTHCAAPLELLKVVSTHWEVLDDDQKNLVLTALCGWLSTRIKRISTDPPLNDADFVGNVCLAIGDCRLFSPLVTEHVALHGFCSTVPDDARWFDAQSTDLLSRSMARNFGSWCDEFFQKSVRDMENEAKRGKKQERSYLSYDTSFEENCPADVAPLFIWPLNVASIIETRIEAQRLMSHYSQEDQNIIKLRADGHSLMDIARLMNTSKSTMQSRFKRITHKALRLRD